MVVKPDGPEILSRPECLRKLRGRSVGRVAVSRQALPAILPLAYALLADDVVFGPRTGSAGSAELERNVVALEVDDIDPLSGAGWSVVVVGVARRFDRSNPAWPAAVDRILHPWALDPAVDLFRLSTQRISGRIFAPGFAGPDRSPEALLRRQG